MDSFLNPREYFHLHGLKPRKRFGQHFLMQPAIAARIVDHAELQQSDVVVEIGPGLGALTQFIAPRVDRLHLVELDWDLAAYLTKATRSIADRVLVHQLDVLQFDFQGLAQSEGKRLVVLGNLPYNISSPLIFHLLEALQSIKRAVFMVQREVGDRLAAGAGSKSYGVLSVLLGVYAQVTKLFLVGQEQFMPKPEVDSLVIRMEFPDSRREEKPSFRFFRSVVNLAFQQRRKTLRNSLRSLLGNELGGLEHALAPIGVNLTQRPETVSPQQFFQLAGILEDLQTRASRV